jgi:two-component system cell cycle sensor histidine kinase/response regulator CckA
MKILHLEDSAEDAALVRALLHAEWPQCEIVVVSTKPDFTRELAHGGYDLILSDFALPQFDGGEALQMVLRHKAHPPFIFVSGNIGEDRAIEAVQAGADDYVLKDRARRLITVIPRALRERDERQRLRASERDRERLAAILEHTPDFVGLAAPDGGVLFLNRAGRKLLGLLDGPLPEGFSLWDSHPKELARRLLAEILPLAAKSGTWSGESVITNRSGTIIPVSQAIIAHRGSGASVEYFSTVMRDLTARKQSEALVNGQNQILEMIAGGEPLEDTLDALVHFIEGQSEAMICSILALTEDGQHLRHRAAPRLPASFVAVIDGQRVGPRTGSCGTAVHRRTAVFVEDISSDPLWEDYRDVAMSHGLRACWSTPIFDVRHRMLGTFAAYQKSPGGPSEYQRRLIDVGTHIAAICLSRHETERQLRAQADILSKASDAIMVTDFSGRITFWNPSAARTYGWSAAEAVGRLDYELFSAGQPSAGEASRIAVERNKEWRGELTVTDRSGGRLIMDTRVTLILDDAGRPQGRLSIATDVTEKKRIEEQIFRAQRLESLGMLSAGIAHDLNNILAPILLAAPMLRDHVSDPNDVRMIDTLEKSAERGAALVRQILGFAQGADGDRRLMQVKHLLQDIACFIEETFPKSIRLVSEIPSDLWPIEGNPTHLHQVLLNLCVNARDAMPDGGTLRLRAENRRLDDAASREIEGSRPGDFLVLHVQDSGTGISPAILNRMWEPFFTTKGTGKGTGLGLSTVRGIVQNNAGFVEVASSKNQGTTFRIYLPGVVSDPGGGVRETKSSPLSRGTGELILVVDDEAEIRNISATILTQHGFRVLTAADGAEAISTFAPRVQDISLVITDLGMPNLGGAALAEVIHRLNPQVKILAVSGLREQTRETAGDHPFIHAFLIKPFRPEALLRTVQSLLESSAALPGAEDGK